MIYENEVWNTSTQYFISEEYRYKTGKKRYKLTSVSDTGIFHFECGHWCTESVFGDLVRCSTGKHNFESKQIELIK